MRIMDRLGDGLQVARRSLEIRNPKSEIRNDPRQAASLDEVHDQEMLPLADADFVDGDDVRVLERRGGDGLGAETLHGLGRRVRPEQQQLEGDDPIQALLTGFIDDAHAPVPDLLQEFVVAKSSDE